MDNKLTWVSEQGDEYAALIGSLKIHLKPVNGGETVEMYDSKGGAWFRRFRSTLSGPMENAMNVAEQRYLV